MVETSWDLWSMDGVSLHGEHWAKVAPGAGLFLAASLAWPIQHSYLKVRKSFTSEFMVKLVLSFEFNRNFYWAASWRFEKVPGLYKSLWDSVVALAPERVWLGWSIRGGQRTQGHSSNPQCLRNAAESLQILQQWRFKSDLAEEFDTSKENI